MYRYVMIRSSVDGLKLVLQYRKAIRYNFKTFFTLFPMYKRSLNRSWKFKA